MAAAPGEYVSSHIADDLNLQITVVGSDLTGVTTTCAIALAKNTPALLTATMSLIAVYEDDDGVPISLVQAFATQASVETMLDGIDGIVPGEDVELYFDFRAASLPGDLGTPAKVTLAAGSIIFKGSVG